MEIRYTCSWDISSSLSGRYNSGLIRILVLDWSKNKTTVFLLSLFVLLKSSALFPPLPKEGMLLK